MKIITGPVPPSVGSSVLVELPVGKTYHAIRLPSGEVVSLGEAARRFAPNKLTVGGHTISPAPEPAELSPLFIPLKREYFEAFERGEKTVEFRVYGERWNDATCLRGRRVVLSFGYGKARRLRGRIVSFERDRHPFLLPGWLECYGNKIGEAAACIGIELDRQLS